MFIVPVHVLSNSCRLRENRTLSDLNTVHNRNDWCRRLFLNQICIDYILGVRLLKCKTTVSSFIHLIHKTVRTDTDRAHFD